MKQRPYSSPLWAHANLIRELRLKRQSWKAIVDVLKAEHGVEINYRSVQAFFKRWVKRKALPLGWEIEPKPTLKSINRPNLKQAPAELPQIREKEKGHEWPTREEANQIIQ
jgi:transposase